MRNTIQAQIIQHLKTYGPKEAKDIVASINATYSPSVYRALKQMVQDEKLVKDKENLFHLNKLDKEKVHDAWPIDVENHFDNLTVEMLSNLLIRRGKDIGKAYIKTTKIDPKRVENQLIESLLLYYTINDMTFFHKDRVLKSTVPPELQDENWIKVTNYLNKKYGKKD